jgi:hypothetical protein
MAYYGHGPEGVVVKKLLVCLGVLVLAVPAVTLAQAYKWVDEHGTVHYTQVPPKSGTKYEPARPAPPPMASPNQDALNKSLSQAVKDEPKKRQEAEKTAAADAKRQQECQGLRDQLAFLESTPPIRVTQTDDAGNVSRATEEQHQQRRTQLQQALRDRCS